MSTEICHYVVTAHPPGGILATCKCNFLSPSREDLLVAKSRKLEIRQCVSTFDDSNPNTAQPLPILLTLPIHGRITTMIPIQIPNQPTSAIFLLTTKFQYAVIRYDPSSQPYPVQTCASGSFTESLLGREAECAPLVDIDPYHRCIALHLYDGIMSFIPINLNYRPPQHHSVPVPLKGGGPAPPPTIRASSPLLGRAYHLRVEERTVVNIRFLKTSPEAVPQIALLHQDSRGLQHVVCHALDTSRKQLTLAWKKSRIDGGSSLLIAVDQISLATAAAASAASAAAHASSTSFPPTPPAGGLLILGQRQITYVQPGTTKVVPLPSCLLLTYTQLPGGYRYLVGDEFGNLHMLTLTTQNQKVTSLELDTLGSTPVLSSSLEYFDGGRVWVGSQLGDSQWIQILEQVNPESNSYLEIIEEYTNLGPVMDMDWVPTHSSASVVLCSGSSISGSLRLVRNGIGMKEYAGVEIPGIQNMWAVRESFGKKEDKYLVQSFVGETRVLGVAAEEDQEEGGEGGDGEDGEGATLEEVVLPGLDGHASTLYVGNVQIGDSLIQITESQVRLLSNMDCIKTWTPESEITVGAANEAGQIVLALRGGHLIYLTIAEGNEIVLKGKTKMTSEVSCVNLNPFTADDAAMEVDGRPDAIMSDIVTVGLWDDFTVRVLSLGGTLPEVLQINLSTDDDDEAQETGEVGGSPVRRHRNNMMARSLCLITLDSTNASSSSHVNMLFVGLGDGTLISFAVIQQDGKISVQSKKEVSLGSQRISLVPLQTEKGGSCVFATGDRPTVVYLAAGGSQNLTPKLCYSNMNLSTSEAEDENDAVPPAESIAVNVATPFFSPQLFDDSSLSNQHYSLCVSDDSVLRLGVIDDIQKLHVTTCRLGMAPRRLAHCPEGKLFAVGCVESGIQHIGAGGDEPSMGNCIRFLDDTTFDDIKRIDLEPHEMVLSMVHVVLSTSSSNPDAGLSGGGGERKPEGAGVQSKPYLLIGTAYALPDEDEPTRGRILVLSCEESEGDSSTARSINIVTELLVRGGVYSMCQFYGGTVLVSVNSKTELCRLSNDGSLKMEFVGIGHHGHILSLVVKSKAQKRLASESQEDKDTIADAPLVSKKKPAKVAQKEQLAIVGDLMRSISLVQYYPEHQALEEIARDFNANWTTAIEMLTDNLYLGAENWSNLYVLRRNPKAQSEEVRCRLDTVGRFHLGEMVNKFIPGSLIMPHSQSTSGNKGTGTTASRRSNTKSPSKKNQKSTAAGVRMRRPVVTIGSQTLFATVDGTLGSILGLDARTAAFFSTLERAMAKVIAPVGGFSHQEFRTFDAESRVHIAKGFVDGDLVESFLDMDRSTMEAVVKEMNRDGGFEIESHGRMPEEDEDARMPAEMNLVVEDVLAMVEEMAMFH